MYLEHTFLSACPQIDEDVHSVLGILLAFLAVLYIRAV